MTEKTERCANCGDPVTGWRAKQEQLLYFCRDECRKDFIKEFFFQMQTDGDLRLEFVAQLADVFEGKKS